MVELRLAREDLKRRAAARALERRWSWFGSEPIQPHQAPDQPGPIEPTRALFLSLLRLLLEHQWLRAPARTGVPMAEPGSGPEPVTPVTDPPGALEDPEPVGTLNGVAPEPKPEIHGMGRFIRDLVLWSAGVSVRAVP